MNELKGIITQIYERSKYNKNISKQQIYDTIDKVLHIYINDRNAKDEILISPLNIEILMNNQEEVLNLIKAGVDINSKDYNGNYPLELAIYLDNYDIAKILIENGVNVNKDDYSIIDIYDPLLLASYYKNCEIVKLLVENGANVNTIDSDGFNTLHYLLNDDNTICNIVRSYCRYADKSYNKPSLKDILTTIDLLVKRGVDVNKLGGIIGDRRIYMNISPLAIALETSDELIIEKLIQSGAKKEVVEVNPHVIYGYQDDIEFFKDILSLDFSLWTLGLKEYKQFIKYKKNIKKYDIEVYSATMDDGYKRPKIIKRLQK